MLYDHFKEKFKKKVRVFGVRRLKKEKDILKLVTAKIKEKCIVGLVDNRQLPGKDRLYGNEIMGYKLKENSGDIFCNYYTKKEDNFINDVRSIQTARAIQMLLNSSILATNINNSP